MWTFYLLLLFFAIVAIAALIEYNEPLPFNMSHFTVTGTILDGLESLAIF